MCVCVCILFSFKPRWLLWNFFFFAIFLIILCNKQEYKRKTKTKTTATSINLERFCHHDHHIHKHIRHFFRDIIHFNISWNKKFSAVAIIHSSGNNIITVFSLFIHSWWWNVPEKKFHYEIVIIVFIGGWHCKEKKQETILRMHTNRI